MPDRAQAGKKSLSMTVSSLKRHSHRRGQNPEDEGDSPRTVSAPCPARRESAFSHGNPSEIHERSRLSPYSLPACLSASQFCVSEPVLLTPQASPKPDRVREARA